MNQRILEVKCLTKIFGGLVAINKLDLEIEKGKITAIIGPNGAGKTTLFNIITGVHAPSEGTLLFNGRALGGSASWQRVKMGIADTAGTLAISACTTELVYR